MKINFLIPGKPIPYARPRYSKGHFYDPTQKQKQQVKWDLKSQYSKAPITSAISLNIIFSMPIPNKCSNLKKYKMIAGDMNHIKKPDIDNLAKFILDCLTDIVIKDDCQIVDLTLKKIYSEYPCTIIEAKII